MQTGQYIDRFGAQAVFGRPLFLHEMKEIIIAENIEAAHKARTQSGDWAKWTSENPVLAELLNKASHG